MNSTKSGKGIKVVFSGDSETSGMNMNANMSNCLESVATGYQAVSWGFVAADATTFEPLDELYVEIKWNGVAKWSSKAEEIHGLSKEYLEKHGMTEEEAIVEIIEFFGKYQSFDRPLFFMGHNWASFDMFFLKEMLTRHGVNGLKFAHRCFDTFALSMGTVQEVDSNGLFERVGIPVRDKHNALDDAKYALETYRRIHKAWLRMLELSKKK